MARAKRTGSATLEDVEDGLGLLDLGRAGVLDAGVETASKTDCDADECEDHIKGSKRRYTGCDRSNLQRTYKCRECLPLRRE